MALSAVLTSHIHSLTGHVGVDNQGTTEAVAELTVELERAVPSYLGLQLTLLDHGHPVTLTVFDPTVQRHQIAASLRLPLSILGNTASDPASAISFYARNAGAFVDLAADLTYALAPRAPAAGPEPSRSRAAESQISIDDPLLPTTVQSGLVGTAELSTINRAIGILIGDGHHPDHAHAELARRALAGGVTILACATQLVRPGRS